MKQKKGRKKACWVEIVTEEEWVEIVKEDSFVDWATLKVPKEVTETEWRKNPYWGETEEREQRKKERE